MTNDDKREDDIGSEMNMERISPSKEKGDLHQ